MDKIASMRAFIRVVQTGSFSAVANEINTTQATISKRVAALEESLKVKLLHRSSREQSLTEAGNEYYSRCLKIIEAIDDAETVARCQTSTPSGLLRITVPLDFSHILMEPLLKNFLKKYPQIKVDLIMTNRNLDLLTENIDLALRGGDLKDSALVAKLLCRAPLQLVASPEYIEEHGAPQNHDDLKHHNCVRYSLRQPNNVWYFTKQDKDIRVQITGNITCDSGYALANAALSGIGIAMIPNWLIHDEIVSGRLTRVLTDYQLPILPIYALYPERKHLPLKVRSFVDYFAKNMASNPAFKV